MLTLPVKQSDSCSMKLKADSGLSGCCNMVTLGAAPQTEGAGASIESSKLRLLDPPVACDQSLQFKCKPSVLIQCLHCMQWQLLILARWQASSGLFAGLCAFPVFLLFRGNDMPG